MTTAVIEQEVKQETNGIVAAAEAYQIVDVESLQAADRLFNEWATKETQWFNKLDPIRASAYETYKKNKALVDEATGPFKEGRAILEKKILAYNTELKRLRLLEESRLTKIRQEQEAESARSESESLMGQAEAAEKSGDLEGAAEIIEEATHVAIPKPVASVIVPSFAPKLSSTIRKTWKWRIKDESKIKREHLIPNQAAIGALVRAYGKRAEAMVGGIEAYEDEGLSKGRK